MTDHHQSVRLNQWALAVGMIGLAFGLLFVFSNLNGLGFGLVAADLLWVITRVEITERHDRAGHYTSMRGLLGIVKLALLLVIYAAAVYGFFVIRHDLQSNARAAVVGNFAIAGLCFMLIAELQRSGEDTRRWLVGRRAERTVGERLDGLKDRGWLVLHGYKKDRGGDVDHILCGPNGAFIVETKSHGFRRRDIGQTAGNAWWVREQLGVRWVTGVLCVDETRPARREGRVWVISHDSLIPWLEAQRGVAVDPSYAVEKLLPNEAPQRFQAA